MQPTCMLFVPPQKDRRAALSYWRTCVGSEPALPILSSDKCRNRFSWPASCSRIFAEVVCIGARKRSVGGRPMEPIIFGLEVPKLELCRRDNHSCNKLFLVIFRIWHWFLDYRSPRLETRMLLDLALLFTPN